MSHHQERQPSTGNGTVNGVATTTLVKGARASRSTIALKLLMAGTGILFIGFVFFHMYGNLKMFAGRAEYDAYAHHLRVLGEPILPREGFLWIMRVVLLAAVITHVTSAATLWTRSNHARSVKYFAKPKRTTAISSRWMRWGGIALLLFIIWHLIEFTVVKVNIAGGPTKDPYLLVVDTFQVWWMTLIYLAALFALAMHLHHGTWSAAQTLGWTTTAAARARAKALGLILAVLIAGGFALVPICILAGVITK